MSLAILLLAAGSASRMRGGDKLMEQVMGRPLIAVMASRALQVTNLVLVALPGPDHCRTRALSGLAVTPVAVLDASEGMGASIRTGVAALPQQTEAVMILPADMPDLTTADLRQMATLWQAHPDALHRETASDGTPGHPVIFPARLFPALRRLSGDTGARAVLKGESILPTALPARHALTDLDTPEDWAKWRAAHQP